MKTAPLPPRSEAELEARVGALFGRSLGDVAESVGLTIADDTTRTKGKLGALLELALGATGGSREEHDFPALEVELKTVPVTAAGNPRESTYVCTVHLSEADGEEWETSWVKRKLSRVLWVPIVTDDDSRWQTRTVGAARLWRPSAEEEAMLRHDYDEVMGLVALGRVDALTAHLGVCLQVRPKAAHGGIRTSIRNPDAEVVETVPRGFYLRPSFTRRLLSER